MAAYHILTLDGGGIRGILTATLLERLEAAKPGLLAQIDLFSGTSTGGILALGLAAGLTPTQARNLYETCGRRVFTDTFLDNLRDIGQLLGSDYSNQPLKEELTRQFGEMTLADLPHKVLISAFDLDNAPTDPTKLRTWKPKFFHNYPGPGSDGSQKVVDVALRTSAAPTFFPIYQGYVDGGVIANNPSMCALAQAINGSSGGQALRDIRLLSIGTGVNPKFLESQNDDWGLARWAPHLISLMLDGNVGLADYQCQQILGKRYHRLNVVLHKNISLDSLKEIPLLQQIGMETDLTETLNWMRLNLKPRQA